MPTIHEKGEVTLDLENDELALWRPGTGQRWALAGPAIRAASVAAQSSLREFWVDPSAGNDSSGDGTEANPWASFSALVRALGRTPYGQVKVNVNAVGTMDIEPLSRVDWSRCTICINGLQFVEVMTNLTVEGVVDLTSPNSGVEYNVGELPGVNAGDYEGLFLRFDSIIGAPGYNGACSTIIEHYKDGNDHIIVCDRLQSITEGSVVSVIRPAVVFDITPSSINGGPGSSMIELGGIIWKNVMFTGGRFTGKHIFYGVVFVNNTSSSSTVYFRNCFISAARWNLSLSWAIGDSLNNSALGISQCKSITGGSRSLELWFENSVVNLRACHFKAVMFQYSNVYLYGMIGISNILNENMAFTAVNSQVYSYNPCRIRLLESGSYMNIAIEQYSFFYQEAAIEQKGSYNLHVRYHSTWYIASDAKLRIKTNPPNLNGASLCWIHGTDSIADASSVGITCFNTNYTTTQLGSLNTPRTGIDGSLAMRVT